jgi:hypothetical protein
MTPEMTAMIARVANLRVAPVGSIGGNLCSADANFVSARLMIAGGTSMLRQNVWPAAGPITGASPTGVPAYRVGRGVRGAGASCLRAAAAGIRSAEPRPSARAFLPGIDGGIFGCLPATT